jgi:hypothetical protein
MPVNPSTWEAEAKGSLVPDNLSYIVKPCLKKRKKNEIYTELPFFTCQVGKKIIACFKGIWWLSQSYLVGMQNGTAPVEGRPTLSFKITSQAQVAHTYNPNYRRG